MAATARRCRRSAARAPRVARELRRAGRWRSSPRSVIALAAGLAHHRALRREPAHGLRRDPLGSRSATRTASATCSPTRRPLIFSALAVAVCFKGGMFNIGVEGQYIVGDGDRVVGRAHARLHPRSAPDVVVVLFAMLGGMAYAADPGDPEGEDRARTRSSRRSC